MSRRVAPMPGAAQGEGDEGGDIEQQPRTPGARPELSHARSAPAQIRRVKLVESKSPGMSRMMSSEDAERYVNTESRRMRRFSASNSHQRLSEIKERVTHKAPLIGSLGRKAKELHATYGGSFAAGGEDGASPAQRSAAAAARAEEEMHDDRCARYLERDCCCGHCKPIEGDGLFRRWWDAVQVLLLLYVALMVPLRTGFDTSNTMITPLSGLWWLELLVDV